MTAQAPSGHASRTLLLPLVLLARQRGYISRTRPAALSLTGLSIWLQHGIESTAVRGCVLCVCVDRVKNSIRELTSTYVMRCMMMNWRTALYVLRTCHAIAPYYVTQIICLLLTHVTVNVCKHIFVVIVILAELHCEI